MGSLNGRVSALEMTIPNGCVACDERARTFSFGEDTGPATCPGCGRPFEVFAFTIRIARPDDLDDEREGM